MIKRMKYSKEHIDWLRENVPGTPYKAVAEAFNSRFNLNQSVQAIELQARKNGIYNGIKGGQFEKGQTPWNKGVKVRPEVLDKIRPTQFKQGDKVWNHRPIGSERIDKNGYIVIKVAEPRKWRLKHLVEWEKYNPPLEKNEAIVFLDQDRRNTDISNLKKVTRSQLAVMTTKRLWQETAEANESATILANLFLAISKRKRKTKK